MQIAVDPSREKLQKSAAIQLLRQGYTAHIEEFYTAKAATRSFLEALDAENGDNEKTFPLRIAYMIRFLPQALGIISKIQEEELHQVLIEALTASNLFNILHSLHDLLLERSAINQNDLEAYLNINPHDLISQPETIASLRALLSELPQAQRSPSTAQMLRDAALARLDALQPEAYMTASIQTRKGAATSTSPSQTEASVTSSNTGQTPAISTSTTQPAASIASTSVPPSTTGMTSTRPRTPVTPATTTSTSQTEASVAPTSIPSYTRIMKAPRPKKRAMPAASTSTSQTAPSTTSSSTSQPAIPTTSTSTSQTEASVTSTSAPRSTSSTRPRTPVTPATTTSTSQTEATTTSSSTSQPAIPTTTAQPKPTPIQIPTKLEPLPQDIFTQLRANQSLIDIAKLADENKFNNFNVARAARFFLDTNRNHLTILQLAVYAQQAKDADIGPYNPQRIALVKTLEDTLRQRSLAELATAAMFYLEQNKTKFSDIKPLITTLNNIKYRPNARDTQLAQTLADLASDLHLATQLPAAHYLMTLITHQIAPEVTPQLAGTRVVEPVVPTTSSATQTTKPSPTSTTASSSKTSAPQKPTRPAPAIPSTGVSAATPVKTSPTSSSLAATKTSKTATTPTSVTHTTTSPSKPVAPPKVTTAPTVRLRAPASVSPVAGTASPSGKAVTPNQPGISTTTTTTASQMDTRPLPAIPSTSVLAATPVKTSPTSSSLAATKTSKIATTPTTSSPRVKAVTPSKPGTSATTTTSTATHPSSSPSGKVVTPSQLKTSTSASTATLKPTKDLTRIAAERLSEATGQVWVQSQQDGNWQINLSAPVEIPANNDEQAKQSFIQFINNRLLHTSLTFTGLEVAKDPSTPKDHRSIWNCTLSTVVDLLFLFQLDVKQPLLKMKIASTQAFNNYTGRNITSTSTTGPAQSEGISSVAPGSFDLFSILMHGKQGKTQARDLVNLLNQQQTLSDAISVLEAHFRGTKNGSWRQGSFKPLLLSTLRDAFGLQHDTEPSLEAALADLQTLKTRDNTPQLK